MTTELKAWFFLDRQLRGPPVVCGRAVASAAGAIYVGVDVGIILLFLIQKILKKRSGWTERCCENLGSAHDDE